MSYLAKLTKTKSEFRQNVLTVMSGTIIGQALPILITPLLTRFFVPAELGVFALYMTTVGLLSSVVTGRYCQAVLLPQKDKDSANLLALSSGLSVITCMVFILVIVLFQRPLIEFVGEKTWVSARTWLVLCPFALFFMGIHQGLTSWTNRKKKYKVFSANKVVRSGTNSFAIVFFGALQTGAIGLVVAHVLAQLLACAHLIYCLRRELRRAVRGVSLSQALIQAKRYVDFPKYRIVAVLLNSASFQTPVILLGWYYGLTTVGFYALANRVIRVPITMVGTAVGQVFIQRVSKEYAEHGQCLAAFEATAKKMAGSSIVPFVGLAFVSPFIVTFVFGKDWNDAGRYVQLLTLVGFLQFVNVPLRMVFVAAEKQREDLIWQIFFFISGVFAIWAGHFWFDDAILSIVFYSIAQSVMYSVSFFLSWRFATGR